MLIIAREARRIVDEGAGHREHEVREVAARTPEVIEPVDEGRSTTWSRWA